MQALPAWKLVSRWCNVGGAMPRRNVERHGERDVHRRLRHVPDRLVLRERRHGARAMRERAVRRFAGADERAVRGRVRAGALVRRGQHEQYVSGVSGGQHQPGRGRGEQCGVSGVQPGQFRGCHRECIVSAMRPRQPPAAIGRNGLHGLPSGKLL